MGKYRGKNGWLHDDSVGKPQRYTESENVQEPAPRSEEPPKPDKLDTCPNCAFDVAWRREEQYCAACGWGKEKPISGDNAGACWILIGLFTVCPLVSTGMGYAIGGVGGLMVGLGVGLAVPIGLCIFAANYTKKERE